MKKLPLSAVLFFSMAYYSNTVSAQEQNQAGTPYQQVHGSSSVSEKDIDDKLKSLEKQIQKYFQLKEKITILNIEPEKELAVKEYNDLILAIDIMITEELAEKCQSSGKTTDLIKIIRPYNSKLAEALAQ